jgi:hypothetical protein
MILALEYDPLVKLFDLCVKIYIILFIFKYLRAHNFGLLSALYHLLNAACLNED